MAGERFAFTTVKWRTESAIGVTNGSWSGDSALPVTEGRRGARSEPLPDDTVRTDLGSNPPIVGPKAGSTWGASMYATGLGTAGTGAVSASDMDPPMAACVGTGNTDTGDTVSTGASATSVPTTSGNITSGVAAGFTLPASAGVEWRVATDAAGTLSPLYGLSGTPADSSQIYATETWVLDSDFTAANSLQMLALSDSSTQKEEFLGCFADSMTITATPGGVAMVAFDGQMLDWADDKTDSLAAATVPSKQLWVDSEFHLVAWAGGSRVVTYAAGNRRAVRGEINLSLQRAMAKRPDPHATQGASMFETSAGDSVVTFTCTVPADDEWRDAFNAQTPYALTCVIGRTAGSCFGFDIDKMHLTEDPGEPQDDNGIMVNNLTFQLSTGYGNGGLTVWRG